MTAMADLERDEAVPPGPDAAGAAGPADTPEAVGKLLASSRTGHVDPARWTLTRLLAAMPAEYAELVRQVAAGQAPPPASPEQDPQQDPYRVGLDPVAMAARERARRVAWTAGLGSVYPDAGLDCLHPQQDPERKVSRWLDSDHRVLWLVGPSHHGKTSAACAIGNAAVERGMTVMGFGAADLLELWRRPEADERYDDRAAAERRQRRRWLDEVDILIIDDLGREVAGNGWFTDRLLVTLTQRLRPGRRLVVTSNGPAITGRADAAAVRRQALLDVEARYGAPVYQRLRNGCVLAWIEGVPLAGWARWEDPPDVDPFA